MSFLTKNDFTTLIKNEVLDEICETDDTLIESVSLMAQQEMESYLNQKFDCADIFYKKGDDRNKLLIMYAIDISLYHIHARVNPRYIPDIRRERYENAIKWLSSVSKGSITPPNLPFLTDGNNEIVSNYRFGSNPKFNSEY